MKYVFLLYDNEDAWDSMDESRKNEVFSAYMAYTEELRNAGAHLAGAPLEHSRTAKRVRASKGESVVQDGPFADGKEQLGGFYMIEARNLDDALDWAARCPCASYGAIEVRPVWDIPH